MIIRHDLKIVFLHVPKCAGKELRKIMLSGSDTYNSEDLFNFSYSSRLHRHVDLAHLPMQDLYHFEQFKWIKDYTVIAAVRNPYERLRSAINEYHRQFSRSDELIVNQLGISRSMANHYYSQIPQRHAMRDLRFVHSMPMTWFTHLGNDPMADYLLRCETLADDFDALAKVLNLPGNMRKEAQENLRNQPIAEPDKFKPILANWEIEFANVLYEIDFNTFDYEPCMARAAGSTVDFEIDASILMNSINPLEKHSHSINIIDNASQVEWHWGPTSSRPQATKLDTCRDKQ